MTLICYSFQHFKNSTKDELKELNHELQETEKLISHLQAQLHQAQSEQAVKVGVSHLVISLTDHYQPTDIHGQCLFLDNQ